MTLFHAVDFLATCVPGALSISGADAMLAILEAFREMEGVSEYEAEYYDHLIHQVVGWRKTFLSMEERDEA